MSQKDDLANRSASRLKLGYDLCMQRPSVGGPRSSGGLPIWIVGHRVQGMFMKAERETSLEATPEAFGDDLSGQKAFRIFLTASAPSTLTAQA